MEQLKRTWAEIDLDALRDNCEQLKGLLKDQVFFMAVVKADAYGHGDVEVAKALQDIANGFAVSNLMEARRLRRAGIVAPILILGYTPAENCTDLFELGVSQTVLGMDYARALSEACVEAGVKVSVHIKVDTGMSRIGFSALDDEACVNEIAKACCLPNLNAEGIFTHFSVADEDSEESDAFTQMQHERFSQVVWLLRQRGLEFDYVHCCNSAAMVRMPSYHHSLVRPGIVMYGCSPCKEADEMLRLHPVMSMKSTISMVKEVPAGESVGYGRTFRCTKPTKVATVAVGYADGYPRALSNKGYVFVKDSLAPVLGNVCMDQMMIDVTGLDVHEGDTVTLFGGDSPIDAQNIAALAGTIDYEILCGVSRRVERVYIRDKKVISVVDYTI